MKQDFSENLKRLRKKAGMTQEEFAKAVEISSMTARRWEWGQREPRMEEIKRIAAALHVTEAELLNGPESNEIKITLYYSEMPKESEIDMSKSEFDLYMGGNGSLGIKGGGKFATVEDIDSFVDRVREQLKQGFAFQQERGAIPAEA